MVNNACYVSVELLESPKKLCNHRETKTKYPNDLKIPGETYQATLQKRKERRGNNTCSFLHFSFGSTRLKSRRKPLLGVRSASTTCRRMFQESHQLASKEDEEQSCGCTPLLTKAADCMVSRLADSRAGGCCP